MTYRLVFVSSCLIALSGCNAVREDLQLSSATQDGFTDDRPVRIITNPVAPNIVSVARELREVDESIDNARKSGLLTKREARKARRQVDALASEADRMGHDGLSDMAARSIEMSARAVDGLINAPMPNGYSKPDP